MEVELACCSHAAAPRPEKEIKGLHLRDQVPGFHQEWKVTAEWPDALASTSSISPVPPLVAQEIRIRE
jgi:hypothetical protein